MSANHRRDEPPGFRVRGTLMHIVPQIFQNTVQNSTKYAISSEKFNLFFFLGRRPNLPKTSPWWTSLLASTKPSCPASVSPPQPSRPASASPHRLPATFMPVVISEQGMGHSE